jgi:hypothetical protein
VGKTEPACPVGTIRWLMEFDMVEWFLNVTVSIRTNAQIISKVLKRMADSSGRWLAGIMVRIPPGACMCVSCECCVSSGRRSRDGLIPCPEESYRLLCVVYDLEMSRMRRSWPTLGCCTRGGQRTGKALLRQRLGKTGKVTTVRHNNRKTTANEFTQLKIRILFNLCS